MGQSVVPLPPLPTSTPGVSLEKGVKHLKHCGAHKWESARMTGKAEMSDSFLTT